MQTEVPPVSMGISWILHPLMWYFPQCIDVIKHKLVLVLRVCSEINALREVPNERMENPRYPHTHRLHFSLHFATNTK